MRILYFTKNLPIKNIGGPCGYLYNIAEYLKREPNTNIYFYPNQKRSIFEKIDFATEKVMLRIFAFSQILRFLITVYYMFFHKRQISKKEIQSIDSYDFVHVHLAFEILQYFKGRNFKHVKIVLTTHNPEPFIYEIADRLNCRSFLDNHTKLRDFLFKRELLAYELSDRILFPVKEAREPYEVSSILFRRKFYQIESKFLYIPTALSNTDMVPGSDGILENKGVPVDALKVCYIGRHNKVKGYDLLKTIAPIVWNEIPECYFCIGGKEGPLYGLSDKRWLELGWVNTSKLLNEVDVFILPNQNTYFDLIFLEALRQGTPIICSKTGGNKWYIPKQLEGILFFEYGDLSELTEKIRVINKLKNSGKIDSLKHSNRKFLQDELNMSIYINRYIDNLKNVNNKDFIKE